MAYKATDIQRALNKNGASLDVDGIIGPKTTTAIKDFQKAKGLEVDGIVGPKTWDALNKASTSGASAQTPAATAPAASTAPTFEYKPSDAVTQADALLQQYIANKPGEWQGGEWRDNLNETIAQILNREKFSYDLNKDMLYQQYKDQYTTQGKLASMDVMGQAAAMTGGYGNSYAQTAGQQAYQAYLQQLNDVVPELYGMARDQYNQEGQDLYKQASLMAQMDEQEYGRYRDKVNDYYTELKRLTENARYMSETEYKQALDDFNIKYGAYRNDVADKQWQTSFDYQKEQDKIANDDSLSSESSSVPKYADFDYDVQAAWKADWEEALATGELGDLEDISDRMVQAGIDPITAAAWFDDYAEKLDKKYKPKKMPNEFTDIYGKYSYSKN